MSNVYLAVIPKGTRIGPCNINFSPHDSYDEYKEIPPEILISEHGFKPLDHNKLEILLPLCLVLDLSEEGTS